MIIYSLRVLENDINQVPKNHMYDLISQNVVILPFMKDNIANQLQFTVVGDDYTVLKKIQQWVSQNIVMICTIKNEKNNNYYFNTSHHCYFHRHQLGMYSIHLDFQTHL